MPAAAHQTHQTIHTVAGTLPPHRVRTATIRSPNFNHLKRVSIPHIQYYSPRGLNTRSILYTLIDPIDTSQNRERPPSSDIYIHTMGRQRGLHTYVYNSIYTLCMYVYPQMSSVVIFWKYYTPSNIIPPHLPLSPHHTIITIIITCTTIIATLLLHQHYHNI